MKSLLIMRQLSLAGLIFGLVGCGTIKRSAVNQVGDALAGGGATFASDDDPELVKAAAPFSLKLMESLLAENPRHQGLLLAAASGFTQYAYAFVQQDADELVEHDFAQSQAQHRRAVRLYLRARDYGLRGLEVGHAGFSSALRTNPRRAGQTLERGDVPLLYWTAAAWGAAIALSKDNPDLLADQGIIEALIDRALALDDAFDHGSIHTFLITYEIVRPNGEGEAVQRSRRHFERAMALSQGQQAGPLVSLAEAVAGPQQDRPQFVSLLQQALAIDADARPEWRLLNLTMQRRARWLLAHVDDIILPDLPEKP